LLDMLGVKQCFVVCTHISMLEIHKVTHLLGFEHPQDERQQVHLALWDGQSHTP